MSRAEIAKTLDVELELKPLKDFQRRTVEHAFERLYNAPDSSHRFLVADEVGLGKTMVARGVIAKAIEKLRGKVERIDVVYVCSNAAIAQQNLNRLNVLKSAETTLATRLTLLPQRIRSLNAQDVNFISFTPGTTFDLKSRGGIKEERALLHRLLSGHLGLTPTPLRNLLQGHVANESWDASLQAMQGADLSDELGVKFRERLSTSDAIERLREACDRFARRREHVPEEDARVALETVGMLRSLLAHVCIDALEPDLVILDEFQRFKDLLTGESEAADLAQALFKQPDVRVLLLSATPYRMVTLSHEEGDDHQRDFLDTYSFLNAGDVADTDALSGHLRAYRRALQGSEDKTALRDAKGAIEERLRRVMSRTERVASTRRRDAMMKDVRQPCALAKEDIGQASLIAHVSHALRADDAIEYWKSSPYLLSFMDRYQVKARLKKAAERPSEELVTSLHENNEHLLRVDSIKKYKRIPHANARMRSLHDATIGAGQAELLWLPPSLPYVTPSGPYKNLGESGMTKALVFSSWNVVPDTIAALLSYEAERLAVGANGADAGYEKHARSRKPLLVFRMLDERPMGMTALALHYPSITLAQHLDPLQIALDAEGPVSLDTVRAYVKAKVTRLLKDVIETSCEGPVDTRWYWAAPFLLDAKKTDAVAWVKSSFRSLYARDEEALGIDANEESVEDDEHSTAFEQHVDEFVRVVTTEKLGPPPEDLFDVIADLTLASPAVCAIRAISRVAGTALLSQHELLTAAARVARGFRVLFNVPESIEIVKKQQGGAEDTPYWRAVLGYCVSGNLQSMLDEYAHLLFEGEGLMGHASDRIATRVSEAMLQALSPRTSSLTADEVVVRPRKGEVELKEFRIRCRFALRYGKLRGDSDKELSRAETVRDAFNSPFRPFVLASTSVGQEGLDFHRYCHAVMHWNLPTNPVDLEQREGRVHRYKGHAVRRNVAKAFGLEALARDWDGAGDPWARIFELARRARTETSDLVPFWIFETEGGVSVERRVPLLPMSREIARFETLKKSLALYRLVFGQARQEDLLAHLGERDDLEELQQYRISLEPT